MTHKDTPIRRKLMIILLLTSGAVLVVTCAAFFAYELLTFQPATVRQLSTLGQIVAANSTAALAFDNEDDAREILAALKAERHIVAAGLYNSQGKLFAKYPAASPTSGFPAKPSVDGYRFENSHLTAFQPVVQNGKRLGTLYLNSDMEAIYERFRLYGEIVALVMAGSFLLAYWLSQKLQKQISEPILALAETAKAISDRRDYSVRAKKIGNDELGLLTDAFNQMLNQIQAQLARLDLLSRTTRAIGERQDLPSIFQVVIHSLEDHLPIDFGCVCLYDAAREALTVTSVGAKSQSLAAQLAMTKQERIHIDENGLSQCVQGRLVYEPDISQVKSAFPQRLFQGGLRSLVVAPLLVESNVFGVLIAARREVSSFSSSDCEFLRQLSEHAALAAHQAQLYTALQQAYDDLRQTQQAVMQQERLSALGQMASGIAHDINNALSPVALYTESLLEKEPNLSPRARDYLQTIEHAIDDVAATVSRMREFYRQREPQLTLAPVRLNDLVQQVLGLTRARWSDMSLQKGVVIKATADLAQDPPAVMGVESEIREALTNLIFNAVDAMPEGGTLTVRTRVLAGSSFPVEAPSCERVCVEVTDTGVGMEEEARRRCLEPFFTTKGERGTGLGLAMVYGMAQRHNVEIEIDSVPGCGTTMRLIFPVPDSVTAGPARFESAKVFPSRLRILVVDDDPMLIKSLRDTLESDGHVVVTANNGAVGIEAFRKAHAGKEPFAVVITDLGMPYVDGRQVASAVKLTSPTTPVILLTGWGQRLVAEGDIPAHVDRVLNKPPKLHELRAALVECCKAAAQNGDLKNAG